jgi:hypothetical protein
MDGNAVIWAWECDFPWMGDYKEVYNTRGVQCDPLCAADSECTHSTYNRGTCFLTRGGAFEHDATKFPGSGYVCGIKRLRYSGNTNPARWMPDFPDASYLHDLLILGADQAIAGPQSATKWTKCHDEYIMDVLNCGYRYFDFILAECRPENYNSFAGAKFT